jgi:hypothetical protein
MKSFLCVVMVWWAAGLTTMLCAAEAPARVSAGGLVFEVPKGWVVQTPNSAMRKAQLKVGSGAESAEVVFFHFGAGQGGGVKANTDRWINQFTDRKMEKVETAVVAGRTIHFVRAEGRYFAGMAGGPPTPQENYGLVGAILESGGGDVFVKMTGPAKLVARSEAAFRAMINGAQ